MSALLKWITVRFFDCFGRTLWTVHSISAQISHEGIKWTTTKENLRDYCTWIYKVNNCFEIMFFQKMTSQLHQNPFCYQHIIYDSIKSVFYDNLKALQRHLLCCDASETGTTDVWWLFPKFILANIIFWIYKFGLGLKRKIVYRKKNWIIEIMDKWLTVPKRVLIVWPRYPKFSKVYSVDMPNWPKSLGYHWKKVSSGFRSPCSKK